MQVDEVDWCHTTCFLQLLHVLDYSRKGKGADACQAAQYLVVDVDVGGWVCLGVCGCVGATCL